MTTSLINTQIHICGINPQTTTLQPDECVMRRVPVPGLSPSIFHQLIQYLAGRHINIWSHRQQQGRAK